MVKIHVKVEELIHHVQCVQRQRWSHLPWLGWSSSSSRMIDLLAWIGISLPLLESAVACGARTLCSNR